MRIFSQEHLHNKYNRYAAMFYTCETSNLVIVTSQILVINKFLNYQFLSYGFNVSRYNDRLQSSDLSYTIEYPK